MANKRYEINDTVTLEKSFATGKDPGAILQMLMICCVTGMPLPEWAARAFRVAYLAGHCGELKSWDEVFGHPPSEKAFTRFQKADKDSHKIWEAIQTQPDVPINDELFEKLGKEFGAGTRETAKRLYKKARRVRGRPRPARRGSQAKLGPRK
jgi:hypothetical protein